MKNYLILLLALISFGARGQLSVTNVTNTTSTTVGANEMFEVAVQLNQSLNGKSFWNPYDPEKVLVYLLVTPPNAPEPYEHYGFFYKEWVKMAGPDPTNPIDPSTGALTCTDAHDAIDNNYLRFIPDESEWRVRFSTNKLGTWKYQVCVKYLNTTGPANNYVINKYSGGASGGTFYFTVVPSSNPGFVKVESGGGFVFSDNNKPFIPMGLNTHSGAHSNFTHFNRYQSRLNHQAIDKVAEGKGNAIRVMITNATFQFHWGSGNLLNYDGGHRQLCELDRIIQHAERKNIYIQLSLESQAQLYTQALNNNPDPNAPKLYKDPNEAWPENPFNLSTSFSTADPIDFFTNPICKEAYKKKLFYILNRWGYSTNIMAFEMFNELEQCFVSPWGNHPLTGQPVMNHVKSWYQEIIGYGKQKDRNKHLFTTSFSNTGLQSNVANCGAIPELDFLSDHYYSTDYNMSYQFGYLLKRQTKMFNKPSLLGEFALSSTSHIGSSSFKPNPIYDQLELHNILWSSTFSGKGGPGFYWAEGSPDMTRDNWAACWGGQFKYFTPLYHFLLNDEHIHGKGIAISTECNDDANSGSNPTYDNTTFFIGAPVSAFNCVPSNQTMDNQTAYKCKGISTSNDVNLEAFALKTEEKIIGWVHYKQNHPGLIRHKLNGIFQSVTAPSPLAGATMTIHNVCKGTYKVEFYNTYPGYNVDGNSDPDDGGIISNYTINPIYADCDGDLIINLPEFKVLDILYNTIKFPDYGFKVTKLSDNWSFHNTLSNDNKAQTRVASKNNRVFYTSDDHDLYMIEPTGNATYAAPIMLSSSNATKVGSNIALTQWGDRAYYTNASGNLRYFELSGSTWNDVLISNTPGEEVGDEIACSANGNDIFYIGYPDYKLHHYAYSGGTWTHSVIYSAPNELGNGKLTVSQDGQHVYYISQDNKLSHYYNSGGSWIFEQLWNNTTENADRCVKVDNTGTNVYYVGGGKIHNYKLSGSTWAHSILQYNSGGTWYDDAVGGCMDMTDDGSHLFYVGTDGYIYQKYHITPGIFQGWIDNLVCFNQLNNDRKPFTGSNSTQAILEKYGLSAGTDEHVFFPDPNNNISSFIWNAGCDALSPYYNSARQASESNPSYSELLDANSYKNSMKAETPNSGKVLSSAFVDNNFKATISPNPFKDQLVIHFNTLESYTVQLINTLGQTIYTGTVDSKDYNINTSQLYPGTYTVLIRNKSGATLSSTVVVKN